VIIDIRCACVDDAGADDDSSSSRYVCVNPTRLARLVVATLVDDGGRRCFVRVDAERFWPKRLGWTRPTPRVVINAVDEIAKFGVIHEALFPILWQVCDHCCAEICPQFLSSCDFLQSLEIHFKL